MHPEIIETVRRALAEDIGSGDLTSQMTVPADRQAEGKFFARAAITVAGIDLLPLIFELRGGVDRLELLKQPGDKAYDGELLAIVHGNARRIRSDTGVGNADSDGPKSSTATRFQKTTYCSQMPPCRP